MKKEAEVACVVTEKSKLLFVDYKFTAAAHSGYSGVCRALHFVVEEDVMAGEWHLSTSNYVMKATKDISAKEWRIRKIIASTDMQLWKDGVPKIGFDFVKRFAKEQGRITHVLVDCVTKWDEQEVPYQKLVLRSNKTVRISPLIPKFSLQQLERAFMAGKESQLMHQNSERTWFTDKYTFNQWLSINLNKTAL